MIEHLTIQDENRIRIDTYNRDLLVSFFEPGKMSNAYVEYNERKIKLHQEKNAILLTNIDYSLKKTREHDIKLYLPNNVYYDMEIQNNEGKTRIENGCNFTHLDVQSSTVEMENTDAFQCGVICVSSTPKKSKKKKNRRNRRTT